MTKDEDLNLLIECDSIGHVRQVTATGSSNNYCTCGTWIGNPGSAPEKTHEALLSDGEWIGIRAAARLAGVHENTIRNWIERGYLQAYQVRPGGNRRGNIEGCRGSPLKK